MDAKLRYVEIKKLFGQYDVEWNIEKDTTVLVGQNGSGKTTILNILHSMLVDEFDSEIPFKLHDLFLSSSLKFSNNQYITAKEKQIFIEKDKLLNFIDSIKDEIVQISNSVNPNKEHLKNLVKVITLLTGDEIFIPMTEGIKEKVVHLDGFNRNDIQVEFISTLNMSANAISTVIASDGKSLNILDIEINQAITSFQKLREQENYSEIKAKVVSALNDFFGTTQKTIELSDTDFVIKNLKKEVLKLSQLSAGERQIIYIVFKVATAYFNEALILMDEPEISLHLEWQEKLLKNLRDINDKSQMIVVTHSPAIIMDGWMDSYVDIQTILKPSKDDE